MFNPITGLPENAVIMDTETTGFDFDSGDRIVEIGAVKMRNGLPTKETFHLYVNPGRPVPQDAVAVHGLTTDFLSQFEPIENVIQGFLDFVGELPMVMHNAPFDIKFVNGELMAMGLDPYPQDRFFDSLPVARKLHPGASATLDALCKRYNISLQSRDKHGALIDSELLAEVMVEMGGGRQTSLFDEISGPADKSKTERSQNVGSDTFVRNATDEELAKHAELVAKLGPDAIWAQLQA